MADDLIQRLRNSPPREICEHGSQKVKCPHCENDALEDALASKDAEIAELRAAFERKSEENIDNLHEACCNRGRAELAESQLAALRERVERAPVVWIDNGACEQDGANLYLDGGDTYFASDDIRGKRVALVALEE